MIFLDFTLVDGGKLHIRADSIVAFEDRPGGSCAIHVVTGESHLVEESYADAAEAMKNLEREARRAALSALPQLGA